MKFAKDSRGIGLTIGSILGFEEVYVGFSWNPLILFNYESVANKQFGFYGCLYLFGFYVSWIKETIKDDEDK